MSNYRKIIQRASVTYLCFLNVVSTNEVSKKIYTVVYFSRGNSAPFPSSFYLILMEVMC